MNFDARIWKQGDSKIITIPKNIAKVFDLNETVVMTIMKKEFSVCRCGKIYPMGEKSDHTCFYVVFSNFHDAAAAQMLMEKVKEMQIKELPKEISPSFREECSKCKSPKREFLTSPTCKCGGEIKVINEMK